MREVVNIETAKKRSGLPDRFWQKVVESGGCWIWIAGKTRTGYGQFNYSVRGRKSSVRAHRHLYQRVVGEVDPGLVLDHVCHNRACVNPNHLRPITQKQNVENRSGPNSNSTSGYRGVTIRESGRAVALVMHCGKMHRAGPFDTVEEAAEAARQLRLRLFTHNDLDRTDERGTHVKPR